MEEHKLRVFENRMLRDLFVLKGEKLTGTGENYIMESI